jgi:hypothetical protein
VQYGSHEKKFTKAIKELRENPDSKLKHVAAYHGHNSKTFFNRYYGSTRAVRDGHPESRKLTPEEEAGFSRMDGQARHFGISPKHKELTGMVVSMLNSKGQRCARPGDHYTTRLLKRHLQVATIVVGAMDRDKVPAINGASLETFFERLQDCIRRSRIDPEGIWNFDETRFIMGHGGKTGERIISRERVKTPRRMQRGTGSG